jgi:hypothetical protein
MAYDEKLQLDSLNWLITNFTIIGFNSRNYDIPMLSLAVSNKSCKILKQATNDIINFGLRENEVLQNYKCRKLKNVDHIDIIEVCPLSANLKLYSGRLHCHKMQDLPFHPDKVLSPEQIAITRFYCVNDLKDTVLLYTNLKTEFDLRVELTKTYGTDLRSKSDAQIAEAVIGGDLRKHGAGKIVKPVIAPGTLYWYKKPDFIHFQSELMQWVSTLIQSTPFFTSEGGKILLPEIIEKTPIKLGNSVYTIGIGGLHSTEKCIAYHSNKNFTLKDVDVESFYPRIILNLRLFPNQLGRGFLNVYNGIVVKRLAAKKAGNKKVSDSLKIVINGSFGKFGSQYSILYSPDLVIQTTITGQLSLLMLIERLELAGIKVISANTDGVVSYVAKHQDAAFEQIVKDWEAETNFKMEETVYSALYSRDINNYIAIKTDGKVKHKGAYSNHWNDNSSFRFHKNPTNLICIDAVTEFLTKGIPVDHTINRSNDITKFITVRTVAGGGVKVWSDGSTHYLGKAIRWYYAEGMEGEIVYAKSGNKVPRSDGAKPLMELPSTCPTDINRQWYIDECSKILTEIGYK